MTTKQLAALLGFAFVAAWIGFGRKGTLGTLAGILRDAGLSVDQLRELL